MKIDPEIAHEKQRVLLEVLIKLYGDDADPILNALQETAARVAIMAGVEPDAYAAGMKYHWDNIAGAVNDHTEPRH